MRIRSPVREPTADSTERCDPFRTRGQGTLGLRSRRVRCGMLASTLVLLAGESAAQVYPQKTIRIVVPFSAGGGTDALARMIVQKFTEVWGQAAVVENRTGAAGTIGAAAVARAAPDGHTMVMGTTSTHVISPHLYRPAPYDPVKDFAPVSLVVWAPNVLVIHPSIPARSVADLIRFAKSHPGQLFFPSSGTGGSIHLAGELFKSMAGIKITHVPYKGATPALIDLVTGQVHLMFATVATGLPFIEQKRLRPLGVTTAKRTGALPDIPTIAEAGLPGYEMSGWIGLLAPAGTPASIVTKISSEAGRFVKSAEAADKLKTLGWDPVGSTPEFFAKVIVRELPVYGKVLKDAGMTAL